jgi:DNA-binding NarL/FixJ family response regulator
MKSIKVVCYDIQPLIVQGIKQAAEKSQNISLIGAFDNEASFINFINRQHDIGIVITGLLRSEGNSLSLIHDIISAKPDATLIVYTVIESKYIIDILISCGIAKVIHKRVDGRELLIQAHAAHDFISTQDDKKKAKVEPALLLNDREISIVNMMAQGMSAEAIAKKLHRSIHTINNQKNDLIKRYACSNSNELIHKLICLGYVDL